MKQSFLMGVVGLGLFLPYQVNAQEVTLIAPGGMRCVTGKMAPEFEIKTGHPVKVTIGSGGGTHQRIVHGDAFDLPVVQPPYQDVLDSGNVIKSSETPLASVPIVFFVRKGDPKPDISTPNAVKQTLLAAKSIGYPDGAAGSGAGLSFDEALKKLGIYEEIKPKVKLATGPALMALLTKGDVDIAVTFASEVTGTDVEVVGPVPKDLSTPTALVAFVSSHAASPGAAQAVLKYLSSPDAAPAYKACGMIPSH
jgi:molybdate transport system substrate-binding protein